MQKNVGNLEMTKYISIIFHIANLKNLLFILFLLFFFNYASPAFSQNNDVKKHELISKCFFVYAALHENGKKNGIDELANYGLQRLMFVRGLFDTLSTNKEFKDIFERDLKSNKAAAREIEKNLNKFRDLKDVKSYNSIVYQGEECDRKLGLIK